MRKATQLSIARTIIHESVHAFIGYSLSHNRNTDMAQSLSAYRHILLTTPESNYTQGELANLTEHNFISHYVDALAKSLSVWDNNRQTDAYYKKLAWAGLESTDAYKARNNQTDIQNAITNEKTGNSKAKGEKCK